MVAPLAKIRLDASIRRWAEQVRDRTPPFRRALPFKLEPEQTYPQLRPAEDFVEAILEPHGTCVAEVG